MTAAPVLSPAQTVRDLGLIARALGDHPGLARALTDAAAPGAKKAELIDAAFAGTSAAARQVVTGGLDQSWASLSAFLTWVERTTVLQCWQWAKADGHLAQAIDDVFDFGQLVARDHEVRALVTDRGVPVERRTGLVRELMADAVAPATEVAAAAVARRRGTIDDAISDYIGIGVELAGARLAVVTVAKPLPSEQRARLLDALQAHLNTPIIIQEVVEPTVLGGVRVECGAEVIDSTLAARLETARREFS